jgi:hypothetical protein
MDGPLISTSWFHSFPRPTRLCRLLCGLMAVFAASWVVPPIATAEEPFIAFLEGLRQRSYFDTAV